ncbi:unnamed protein product [Blepharisma stoltei]|uniref:Uncharacterized protein n=1 Tax=Blepharisma stoltei TaxID=1481888 RepID=A0AAU9IT66_9CILI|nr:unnamed protein product [Blepharisma stoltei]
MLSPQRSKGARKDFIKIAQMHNPSIQWNERLGKAHLEIIAFNYEPTNELFSKGANASLASKSIESTGAVIIPSSCCDLDGLKAHPYGASHPKLLY